MLSLNIPLCIVGTHVPLDCSQIYLGPEATREGKALLAKTRDLSGRFEHVVLHRCYPDRFEMVEVNASDSVSWPGGGANSHGVGYATSGVWPKRTRVDLDRVPDCWMLINCHVLLRNCCSLDEYSERLREQPRASPLNVVAGDTRCGAALEATAAGASCREGKRRGIIEDVWDGPCHRTGYKLGKMVFLTCPVSVGPRVRTCSGSPHVDAQENPGSTGVGKVDAPLQIGEHVIRRQCRSIGSVSGLLNVPLISSCPVFPWFARNDGQQSKVHANKT